MPDAPDPIARARALRRDSAPAEQILWRELRNRRSTHKFRRQHPIGPYFADFICVAARIVVELDGDTHFGREEHDARRTRYLEAAGWRVLRFWNVAVHEELDGVIEAIGLACDAATGRMDAPPVPAPVMRKAGQGTRS